MDFNQHLDKEINLVEFEALCSELFKQRKVIEEKKEEIKKEQVKYDELESKVIGVLTDTGKEKYHVENFGTLYFSNRETVSMPKDPEARAKFFTYLKEKGHYESLITVNSQTLNSYYRQEADAANSPDFKIPGLNAPSVIKSLGMRRGK